MADSVDKQIELRKWGCIGSIGTIAAGLIGLMIWAMKQKPDELKGPPVTVSIQAELDPGMESESVTVQFHRDGGSFLTERKLPSGTINLSKANPKGTVDIVLPGSGGVRYEVSSECWLASGHRTQGFCRRKNEDENDSMIPGEPVLIQGNTTLHVVRSVSENNVYEAQPDAPLAFRYAARLQAKPGPNPEAFAKLVTVAGLIRDKDGKNAVAGTGKGKGKGKSADPPRPPDPTPPPPKVLAEKPKPSADGRTWTAKDVSYELLDATRDGDVLTVTVQAVNAGADKDVRLALAGTKMVDNQGDPHTPSGAIVGRQTHPAGAEVTVPVPQDTRVRFRVRFAGVGPDARGVASFTLAVDGERLAFKNVPIVVAAAPPPPTPPAPPPLPGAIVVRSKEKLVAAVTIEVDGKKVADWPKEQLEVRLPAAPGKHRVVVRSAFKERFLSQAFDDVEVAATGDVVLRPDAVKPDAPQRVSWSHKDSTFTYLNGGKWLEVSGRERFNFVETARVTDYVELHDAGRNCTVRLYATAALLKGLPGYPDFKEFVTGGKWAK